MSLDRALPEAFAARLLALAVAEQRAAELLACLFGGGSATIDSDGRLVLVTGEQLADMMTPWEADPPPVLLITLDDNADLPDLGDIKPGALVWNDLSETIDATNATWISGDPGRKPDE